MQIERLAEVRSVTGAELASLDAGLLTEFPTDRYMEALAAIDPYRHYHDLAGGAAAMCEAIESRAGKQGLCLYHRHLLVEMIARLLDGGEFQALPAEIQSTYQAVFDRIVAQLGTNAIGYYAIDNDLFLKDLALCRLKLVPCGIALIESVSGLPRSLLLRDGPWAALTGLWWVARNLGGFRPLYGMHLERQQLREFTPQGWTRCYLRIAQMLEHQPGVRGAGGGTWWFDPQLESISPELRYLRTMPEKSGARFFRVGPDEGNLAIRFSEKRKRLYEEGAYVPTNYMMVWPRDALIDWARRTGAEALAVPGV